MSLTIRPTEKRDLPRLLEIYNHEVICGTATLDLHPKSAAEWNEWYAAHTVGNHFALTAEMNGEAIGYASLSGFREKEAYVTTTELSIYVDEKYRHHGVASALMAAIISAARARGDVHTIVSVIISDNAPSAALHKKFDFVYCGTVREVGQKFGKMLHIETYQLIL